MADFNDPNGDFTPYAPPAASFIPCYIGTVTGLGNAVMIFGEQRRCLHDQLAGTQVVLALHTR
jgi:hypothetical protein